MSPRIRASFDTLAIGVALLAAAVVVYADTADWHARFPLGYLPFGPIPRWAIVGGVIAALIVLLRPDRHRQVRSTGSGATATSGSPPEGREEHVAREAAGAHHPVPSAAPAHPPLLQPGEERPGARLAEGRSRRRDPHRWELSQGDWRGSWRLVGVPCLAGAAVIAIVGARRGAAAFGWEGPLSAALGAILVAAVTAGPWIAVFLVAGAALAFAEKRSTTTLPVPFVRSPRSMIGAVFIALALFIAVQAWGETRRWDMRPLLPLLGDGRMRYTTARSEVLFQPRATPSDHVGRLRTMRAHGLCVWTESDADLLLYAIYAPTPPQGMPQLQIMARTRSGQFRDPTIIWSFFDAAPVFEHPRAAEVLRACHDELLSGRWLPAPSDVPIEFRIDQSVDELLGPAE